MSLIVRLLCFATVLFGLVACGKDRSIGVNFPATNNAGVEASLTFMRLDAKWAVAQFHLSNSTGKPLGLIHSGLGTGNLSNFTLTVAGGPAFAATVDGGNPFANFNEVTTSGAATAELPPGGSLDLTLKWRLLNQPAKNSDWTMKVTNLTQGGAPLEDVVINRPVL